MLTAHREEDLESTGEEVPTISPEEQEAMVFEKNGLPRDLHSVKVCCLGSFSTADVPFKNRLSRLNRDRVWAFTVLARVLMAMITMAMIPATMHNQGWIDGGNSIQTLESTVGVSVVVNLVMVWVMITALYGDNRILHVGSNVVLGLVFVGAVIAYAAAMNGNRIDHFIHSWVL